MANRNQQGFRRIVAAAGYSLSGLRFAWRNEAAFRQELVLCVVLVPAAFWAGTTAVQRALLIGSCLIVLIVELMNTAVEAVVDRISPEHNELSGHAKDLGSAAVLVSLVLCGCSWLLVLCERFGPG